MAGSLIKIDEEIVTGSSVPSVTLTGITSTYNVYMLQLSNVRMATDSRVLYVRFTASGTANTTSNYDRAMINLRTDTTFTVNVDTNQTFIATEQGGTGASEVTNANFFLFNFNNGSEYSMITYEGTARNAAGTLSGKQGGGILTVNEVNDGVYFFTSGGNINTGSTFTLYGLKK